MAIIYVDRLDTTLAEPLDASSTQMMVSPAASAAIRAAFAWWENFGDSMQEAFGSLLMRLPLYIDNGVAVERVDATFASSGGIVTIMRGTPSYAFGAGTAVRCAPPATRVAEGFEVERSVTGAACLAVPGETAAWTPTGVNLDLAIDWIGGTWTSVVAHAGECWPARVVIANAGVARTVNLYNIDYSSPLELFVVSSPDGYPVSAINLTAACQVAVLTVRKLPLSLRSAVSSIFTMTVEVFG